MATMSRFGIFIGSLFLFAFVCCFGVQNIEGQVKTGACYFTVDDEVVKVYFNGKDVTKDISSLRRNAYDAEAMKDFKEVKYFFIDDVYAGGTLAIMGKDNSDAKPEVSALIFGCVALSNVGNWHRLTSNATDGNWAVFASSSPGESASPRRLRSGNNVFDAFPEKWYLEGAGSAYRAKIAQATTNAYCNHFICYAGHVNLDGWKASEKIWPSDVSDGSLRYSYAGFRVTIQPYVQDFTSTCTYKNMDEALAGIKDDYCVQKPNSIMCAKNKYKTSAEVTAISYDICEANFDNKPPVCKTLNNPETIKLYPRIFPASKCECIRADWDDDFLWFDNPACSDSSLLTQYFRCYDWQYAGDADDHGDVDLEQFFNIDLMDSLGWTITDMLCNDKDTCQGGFCDKFGVFNDPVMRANGVWFDSCRRKCPHGYYCNRNFIGKCAAGTVCDKKYCNGNYYCRYGNVPRACNAGCRCPENEQYGVTFEIDCGPGSYCPKGSAAGIPCPIGAICPLTNQVIPLDCDPGSYCLSKGLSEPRICPPGYYCKGKDTPPQPCSKNAVSKYYYAASEPVPCTAEECDRYLDSSPAYSVDILTALSGNTYSKYKTSFQSTYKLVGGFSIFNSVVVQGSNPWSIYSAMIQVKPSETLNFETFGALLLRNVNLVGGKKKMTLLSQIILEDSAINIRDIEVTSGFGHYPAIILRGSSHLMGLDTYTDENGVLRYDIPKNLIIEFDNVGETTAIIGCDDMPSCDAAPFIDPTSVDSWRDLLNDLAAVTLNPSVSMAKRISAGSSSKRKWAVLRSLVQCAAHKEGIHNPSVYLARAMHCAVQSDSSSYFAPVTFIEVNKTVDYILESYTLDTTEKSILQQIKQVAIERLKLNDRIVSKEVIVVPRFTLDFILNSPKPANGTLAYYMQNFTALESKIESIEENMPRLLQDLFNLKGQELANRIREYSIASEQASAAKSIADAQFNASETAIQILKNRALNSAILIDDLAKRIQPLLRQAYEEISSEMENGFFDFIMDCITIVQKVGSGIATMVDDPGAGSDILFQGVFMFTRTMQDPYDGRDTTYKSLYTSQKLKHVRAIFDELGKGIDELNALADLVKNKADDQSVGFNLPTSRWKTIANNFIDEVFEAGCGSYDQEDVPSCYTFKSLMLQVADVQVEMSQIMNSMIDLLLTREVSQKQINIYTNLIKGWSQVCLSTECKKDAADQFLSSLDNQLSNAQKVFQSALSRVQLYSLGSVKNGIQAMDTLCRAAVYYNPYYINDTDWISLCNMKYGPDATMSYIRDNVIKRFTDKFGDMPDPPALTIQNLEITQQVDLKKFREEILKGSITYNPNLTIILTPDMIPSGHPLFCKENIVLHWVGFYLSDKSGEKLSAPDQATIQVRLDSPSAKKVHGSMYYFNFQDKLFETGFGPSDTISTLYKQSPYDNLNAFARPALFGRYTIVRRAGRLFDAGFSGYRAWLQVRYFANEDKTFCNAGLDCTQFDKKNCLATPGCAWTNGLCKNVPTKPPVAKPTKKPVGAPSPKPTKKPVESPTKKPIAPPSLKPTKKPADRPFRGTYSPTVKSELVTCKLTADDSIVELWVNGVDITSSISGDLNEWREVKTVTFNAPLTFPQVIAIKASEQQPAGSSVISGFMMQCVSAKLPKWNFTTKPGTGWVAFPSDSGSLPPNWYDKNSVGGETDAVQSTSWFSLNGVSMDQGDKIWGPGNAKYMGLKKVIN